MAFAQRLTIGVLVLAFGCERSPPVAPAPAPTPLESPPPPPPPAEAEAGKTPPPAPAPVPPVPDAYAEGRGFAVYVGGSRFTQSDYGFEAFADGHVVVREHDSRRVVDLGATRLGELQKKLLATKAHLVTQHDFPVPGPREGKGRPWDSGSGADVFVFVVDGKRHEYAVSSAAPPSLQRAVKIARDFYAEITKETPDAGP